MGLSPGEEFKLRATPSPELWRRLAYLAESGTGSLLTPATQNGATHTARNKTGMDMLALDQLLAQQRAREEQLQLLNDRIDALSRASTKAVAQTQERLEELRRNANRTIDGRLVFQDEDGAIFDENDQLVDPDDIDRTTWRTDGPNRQDFLRLRSEFQDAQEFHQRVQDVKDRVETNPTGVDLDTVANELDALEAAMPASVAHEYRPPLRDNNATVTSTSAAKLYDGDEPQGQRALRDPFSTAVTPVEPIENQTPAPAPGVTPAPG